MDVAPSDEVCRQPTGWRRGQAMAIAGAQAGGTRLVHPGILGVEQRGWRLLEERGEE
jgi:hypothetical protein